MGLRRRWTREELLLVLHLYHRIAFGRQHSRAPEVVELAHWLHRTPSSIAMKLNNFTSLDPSEAERGVRGLKGSSDLDRQIWREFRGDPEELAAQCELLWERLHFLHRNRWEVGSSHQSFTHKESAGTQGSESSYGEPQEPSSDATEASSWAMEPCLSPTGPTGGERMVRVRYAQRFFRRAVLSAYSLECCITGNPIPQLLVASHILPWASYPEHRVNPHNGLCLSRLHDAAFDQHLIALDEEYRLVLSKSIRDFCDHTCIQANFSAFEGQRIRFPQRFLPSQDFLATHREQLVE